MRHLIITSNQKHRTWVHWTVIVAGTLVITGLGLLIVSSIVIADEPRAPVAQDSAGKALYDQHCAACHGINGDGAGPAADRFYTKPRDFTRDEYKIKSTAGDEFPSRDDLIRVIAKGMPGSAMPAWAGVLSNQEMGELGDYIQTFGRFFSQEGYGTTSIEVPRRVEPAPESIARGKELYEGSIECIKCHGPAGRGNGSSAFELTDNAGNPIFPADLTQPNTFRGGAEPEQVYLRLRTGLTGSPMPSFADALSEDETWDLVNYVFSLSAEESLEPAVLLQSRYIPGPLPDELSHPAWNIPSAYYPFASQLMRSPRHYQPAINAVWVRSLYNDQEIGFYVTWNDRTETRSGDAVDAFAIQLPVELYEGNERPYFVFGDTQRPVYQLYWSADKDGVVERNARGLDAIEEQPEEQQQTRLDARYVDGQWQLTFRRPLQTEDGGDLAFEKDRFIPISFMVWDGSAGEGGSRMGLTTWSTVFLESPPPSLQMQSSFFAFPEIPLNFIWVPIVVVVVLILELALVAFVRYVNNRSKTEET